MKKIEAIVRTSNELNLSKPLFKPTLELSNFAFFTMAVKAVAIGVFNSKE
jgi:hypothetical protein